MFIRLLGVLILVAFTATGCATGARKAEGEQLQTRVVELEKKLEEKDAEIVDLQYEVKDLSSKVETASPSPASEAQAEPEAAVGRAQSTDDSQIIRVNTTPWKVQDALKSAGLYNGKIDGKIGPATRGAIMEFQKAHGLKADGIVGKKTWDELKTYLQ